MTPRVCSCSSTRTACPSTTWSSASFRTQLPTIREGAGEVAHGGRHFRVFGAPALAVQLQGITAEPGTGLELVTLASLFPAQEAELFFRIQPNFNPDNFEKGLLADVNDDRLIRSDSSLRNLDNDLGISYQFVPGRVLFFKVKGTRRNVGGSVYGGTAEDGATRDFIYRDDSHLGTAALHAGLLGVDEQGVIKVTLLPIQAEFRGSFQTVKDGGGETVFSEPLPGDEPLRPSDDEIFSYRIDLVRILDR